MCLCLCTNFKCLQRGPGGVMCMLARDVYVCMCVFVRVCLGCGNITKQ